MAALAAPAAATRRPRAALSVLPPFPAAPDFLGGVPFAATCLPLLGGAFLAAGAFLACCALQAADLALVLQGSEFLAACAAGGRSAHTASAAGAMAFAIARFQEKAMVGQACGL